jgi:hypothetical protein
MKLTPVEYRLPEPFAYVSVCYCSGFAPKGIAKEKHKPPYWYVSGGGRKPYWRKDAGWFDTTPTQFKTPLAAAKAFWKWATDPQECLKRLQDWTPEQIERFNNLTPEKIREMKQNLGFQI